MSQTDEVTEFDHGDHVTVSTKRTTYFVQVRVGRGVPNQQPFTSEFDARSAITMLRMAGESYGGPKNVKLKLTRETQLTELIYTEHPRFAGTPTMHGLQREHVRHHAGELLVDQS